MDGDLLTPTASQFFCRSVSFRALIKSHTHTHHKSANLNSYTLKEISESYIMASCYYGRKYIGDNQGF